MQGLGLWQPPADGAAAAAANGAHSAAGFRALDCESVKAYVAQRPALQVRVSPCGSWWQGSVGSVPTNCIAWRAYVVQRQAFSTGAVQHQGTCPCMPGSAHVGSTSGYGLGSCHGAAHLA